VLESSVLAEKTVLFAFPAHSPTQIAVRGRCPQHFF
jgi:hypothetical protein